MDGAFADPFIQVVDDLGAAIVEHQLRGRLQQLQHLESGSR